ncbi:MAG: sugar phosphate nucleotidyltransferase [Candidatus Omnitrophica bacterium]|nr:sugar phosphate nucleotidyltransferase [Candidatus Omnitrophota bacterium]
MRTDKPIVLIMCGGKSLRLWPLSEYKSKNFLDIFGFSPLELTIKRFLKVTPIENIFLVANYKERETLRRIKIVRKENIFLEPESKNTAAAILLSIFCLRKKIKGDNALIVSPVDHLIKEEKNFLCALSGALVQAEEGWICTLGIKPAQPTPNFGYIEVDGQIQKGVFAIKRFIEKPTRMMAAELINKGDSFYNSGMFISSLSTLDKEYKKYYLYYRDFAQVFEKSSNLDRNIKKLYRKIEDTPFDKAIMEKTKKCRLIKSDFFWKDFGSWHAIYDVLPKDARGNVKKGAAFVYNGENNLIYLDNTKKKILVIGLEGIVFVDTEKYTLLTHRNQLDDLKSALKEMRKTP